MTNWVNGSRVPQGVGRNPFLAQSRSFLCGRLKVLFETKAHTGSTQGVVVAVAEYYFVGGNGVSLQKRVQKLNRFRPQRGDALFTSFSPNTHLRRRIQTNVARANVECLRDTSTGVIEYGQYNMVALA